jgi:hypothetical protein
MHLDILVEDTSGRITLEILIPKILDDSHTVSFHSYRGIGHLPPGLKTVADPQKSQLLSQLPRLLQGFGATYRNYPANYRAAVVLVCDLDARCRHDFRLELQTLLESCDPRPEAYFCIAEEEVEAWLLGDTEAIYAAYPSVKRAPIDHYVPDSICGTWETLAEAVHPGGAKALEGRQYFEVGTAKCAWAREIPIRMDVEKNHSPSFNYFKNKVRGITGE